MNKIMLSVAILGTIAIQPLSVLAEDKPAATASIPGPVPNPDPYANETKEQRDARMAWFRDGRFGMFVHWGPYAVLGGEYKGKRVGGNPEWIQHTGRIPYKEYEQISASFNPASFDAAAIVRYCRPR